MSETLSKKAAEAMRYIQKEALRHGKLPSIRKLMQFLGYKSPNSAALVLKELSDKKYIRKRSDGSYFPTKNANHPQNTYTTLVPLVGNAACGLPIYAEENIEAMIPVAANMLRPNKRYFFVRAQGDSMNKAGIDDGSLVLIEERPAAENGQRVLALIDGEATIKLYSKQADAVLLKPSSTNNMHQPMVLQRNFQVQGIVSAVLKNF